MSPWLVQHFLNSSYFWPGVALVAAPILIHLIHRLRYRRVRFAAMEFLLASNQRNRRRILFEQLLLLLLRILLILLIVALLARLIIDPSELSLFQGAKSHHVVILDDSLSMRSSDGAHSAFEEAKSLLRKLVAEGAQRPGTQKLTLIRSTHPDESLSGLSERDIDDSLVLDLTDRLETMECTHQAAQIAGALESAVNRLEGDRSAAMYVHLLSDYRQTDWLNSEALTTPLKQLSTMGAQVNLVRCTPGTAENLGIVALGGSVEVAAAGVPVTFTARVRNWGTRLAEGVRAQILVDGERLPRTLEFGGIDPNQEAVRQFDVVFDKPMLHKLQLVLDEDALLEDNTRFLAIHVPVENPVLIVDGSPSGDQALYVADALAADKSITGFAPEIRKPDDLRKLPLEKYHLIYMIDVAELAIDAVEMLSRYVEQGGGLIWYLGDSVRPGFYNEQLFQNGSGPFPIRIGSAPTKLTRPESSTQPDIIIGQHAVFQVLAGEENPFVDAVFVNLYYPQFDPESPEAATTTAPSGSTVPPVSAEPQAVRTLATNAIVLATLRNRAPLILEHALGEGRIITCLTSAGPLVNPEGIVWTNWANGPGKISFVVLQLELARHVSRRDRTLPVLDVGTPIVETLSRGAYRDELEFVTPDNQVTRVKAASESTPESNGLMMSATFRDTDHPGFYGITRLTQDQQPEAQLIAFNVPSDEGSLAVASDQELLRTIGSNMQVSIQPYGKLDWIRSDAPGSEMRWLLLLALFLVGFLEQSLAYRLSYHQH